MRREITVINVDLEMTEENVEEGTNRIEKMLLLTVKVQHIKNMSYNYLCIQK